MQGAGDKNIGTVVVLARKTVPIIFIPSTRSGREIYAEKRAVYKYRTNQVAEKFFAKLFFKKAQIDSN